MTIQASQIYNRQAPRKVRLVANTVKSLPLAAAFQQLAVMDRNASILVMKVLRQAVANATHNYGLQVEDLAIKSITVDGGSLYKRFRAVSRGRAHSIVKKTCHVNVELIEKKDIVTKAKPAAKTAAVKAAPEVRSEDTKPKAAEQQKSAPKKAVEKKADK
jgi:large subunit ribosomal protein L22